MAEQPAPPTGPHETLPRLAAAIERAGLRTPATLMLGVLEPVDFLSTQAALFAHPFVRGLSWEPYALALQDEANWRTLRTLLARER